MIITINMFELYKCDEGLYVSILNKARTCIALIIVTYHIIMVVVDRIQQWGVILFIYPLKCILTHNIIFFQYFQLALQKKLIYLAWLITSTFFIHFDP
jgi:hypothetical protein